MVGSQRQPLGLVSILAFSAVSYWVPTQVVPEETTTLRLRWRFAKQGSVSVMSMLVRHAALKRRWAAARRPALRMNALGRRGPRSDAAGRLTDRELQDRYHA